ncbi:phosphodiesterase [Catenisphaera adipataccumulans]|jgi:putative phosphoesterase|uniref:Phosphoesterase n=1 Tax=Catenisphaera adipataccumulans TaxID=700500 RepID=A0A7W8CXP0_9FIRM|nr:phosphodiesterase [Catenisphaera adipataccumulans]MBB5182343.1 hypothetical protein [Catenisphaera adipataccumulans]
MKWMIASDIHGSAYYCKKTIEAFSTEQADRLLLLGDILYHGPRNDLPRDYDPKTVVSFLNGLTDKIFCIRGNCDAEIDQKVLDFPLLPAMAVPYNGHILYVSHGHTPKPELQDGDLYLQGHTHVPTWDTTLNPGSTSIPKKDSRHSYMIWQDNKFVWKDLNTGAVYQTKIWE